jgi:enamine deaminase RidA (YjgF/YER057c/UK114 family)
LPRRPFASAFCAALLTAAGVVSPLTASAQSSVKRIPLPNNSTFPISQGVWVGDTLYLSGTLDSSLAKTTPGDTEAQTVNVLKSIQQTLAEQHLTLGDIVLMHAYLAADPNKGGKMDFAGFMAGYSQFFGTRDQPGKPARSRASLSPCAMAHPSGSPGSGWLCTCHSPQNP